MAAFFGWLISGPGAFRHSVVFIYRNELSPAVHEAAAMFGDLEAATDAKSKRNRASYLWVETG